MKTLVIAVLLCIMTMGTYAQTTPTDVPRTISYQGAINTQDGAPLADGQYNITVSFYTDANGTSKVWQGTYPATVTKGIFNLMLGSGASPFASTAMFNQPLWVGVKVGDGDEMRPLSQLTSAPSALGVADSSITASKMGTNYVAGIAVNGTPITGVGSTVNLVGAGSTSLLYDQQTNSIIVNATGASVQDSLSNGGVKNGGAKTEGLGNPVIDGSAGSAVNTLTMWSVINPPGPPDQIVNSSVTDVGGVLTTTDATLNVNPGAGQYQIGGVPVLTISPGTDNTFVGIRAAVPIIAGGDYNTATGYHALWSNTSGYDNNAYGYYALSNNTTIGANVGITNDAFGTLALTANTTGESNDAFGYEALGSTTTPNNNSGFGFKAGLSNVLGANNTFIGYNTAATNTSGNNLTMLGFQADVGVNGLVNATAIGNGAIVNNSNAMQLGNTAVTAVTTAGTLTTGMTSAGTAGSLIFNDGTASGFTSSFTIGSQAANIAYTLPIAQGLAGQVLTNNGSGALSWTSTGGISGVTASSPLASSGGVTPNISLTGIVGTANGGTGLNASSASNGQLLIGNGSGFSLATLTAGTNITITNSPGGIQIDATGGGGVSSVGASSPLASSGGATPNISLTGIVGVTNGGTGDNTLTAHGVMIGEGTSAVVVSSAMTAGQLLVGQGATSDPSPETIAQDMTLAASGNATVVGIQTIPVSGTAPTLNQILQYNGTSWVPTSFSPGGVTSVTASAPLAATAGASPNISVTPGANNTFMTTDNSGVVGFNALSVDGVTLKGDGSSTALAINLDNANTWTNTETFAPKPAHNVTSMVIKQTAAGGPVSDVLTVENSTAANNFFRVQSNGDVEISANGNAAASNTHIHVGGINIVPNILGPGILVTGGVNNDIAGIASFTTVAPGPPPPVAGNQISLCVNNNYPPGSTVVVVVTGTDAASAALGPFAFYAVGGGGCGAGVDHITIATLAAPALNTVYHFSYHVEYLK